MSPLGHTRFPGPGLYHVHGPFADGMLHRMLRKIILRRFLDPVCISVPASDPPTNSVSEGINQNFNEVKCTAKKGDFFFKGGNYPGDILAI